MLTVWGSARIYLAAGATDMRKSFNGLYALSKGKLGADPLEGHLFLFCNRRRDRGCGQAGESGGAEETRMDPHGRVTFRLPTGWTEAAGSSGTRFNPPASIGSVQVQVNSSTIFQ